MNVTSATYNQPSRAVTAIRNDSDRSTHDESRLIELNQARQLEQSREQQRAQQQRIQQQRAENQRRLDGRLYSLGQPGGEVDQHQAEVNRANYNREKVREAYSPPKNELTNSHSTTHQLHEAQRQQQNNPIDLVV